MTKAENWKAEIGGHRGTMISRDMGTFSTNEKGEPLTSLEDCIIFVENRRKYLATFGGYLWYAHAIAPNGTVYRNIVPGTPYS